MRSNAAYGLLADWMRETYGLPPTRRLKHSEENHHLLVVGTGLAARRWEVIGAPMAMADTPYENCAAATR